MDKKYAFAGLSAKKQSLFYDTGKVTINWSAGFGYDAWTFLETYIENSWQFCQLFCFRNLAV